VSASWTAVIGLEVHCQLKTATKLFCGCKNQFGAEPNALTCPVCAGHPGALPVLNEQAIALALRAALALGGEIALLSRFERKSYFYCDLPKGYQISQYAIPYCRGGGIVLRGGKRVRLQRIHLEEDAGKAIHDRGERTLVDLNRAGVPLIESVTEPDVESAEQAHEYLSELKRVFQYAGVSDCDMEKGSLRCDVNVSVRRPSEPLRTKVELKNLNSFTNIKAAIEHEIARQIALYEAGDEARYPVQETRLWDARKGASRTMRTKEDAHDYRYFQEPDLPPLEITPAWIERERSFLPELPAARRARYVRELGLSEYDAEVLTASRATADFFERTVELCGAPKEAANWIANRVLGLLSDPAHGFESVDALPFKPRDLAELIGLLRGGRISQSAGQKVLAAMLSSTKSPLELARELGLEQVDDAAAIERWCREALVGKDEAIADIRAGKHKALGALIGPVMAASGGRANPARVRETLLAIITGESPPRS
jgi:aspartyl-tRNA(Asn)/glutamyl-tRNA(Gln) amidotransferase subunit B